MAKITPARQRNAVSEGTAFGLLMNDVDEIPDDKLAIDLAFAGAWRNWVHRDLFPQVNTDLRQGLDPIWALTRVDERKQTSALFWERSDQVWVIYLRPLFADDDEIDPEEMAGFIDGDLPPAAWRDLAADFLARLSR